MSSEELNSMVYYLWPCQTRSKSKFHKTITLGSQPQNSSRLQIEDGGGGGGTNITTITHPKHLLNQLRLL
jgi:hypothetical protein